MKTDDEFVKSDYKGNKKKKKGFMLLPDEAILCAYVICEVTGEIIRLHPDIVNRLLDGETIGMHEAKSYKWH